MKCRFDEEGNFQAWRAGEFKDQDCLKFDDCLCGDSCPALLEFDTDGSTTQVRLACLDTAPPFELYEDARKREIPRKQDLQPLDHDKYYHLDSEVHK